MRKKKVRWKCDVCGNISYARKAEEKTFDGKSMPEFGWKCWENNMRCGGQLRRY